MKRVLVFLTIAMVVLGSFVFAEDGVYEDKVVIGSFQALSGPVAPIGVSMRKGMDAYFNWVNNTGGVYGRNIDLIVVDDQFSPSKTVVEVRRLVEEDKVFSIVGGLGSPGCLAVMDYLNDRGVPFVYQGSGSSILAIPPKEYIFTVQPHYTTEGQIAAKYMMETLGAKRVAIIYRADDAGREGLNSMSKWLLDNGYPAALVAKMPVDPNKVTFDSEILKLLELGVDAVYLLMWIPQSPNFLMQAQEYGLDATLVGSYANPDITLIYLAGQAAEGFQSLAWVAADPEDEGFLEYIKIYQETFPGEIPNAYAAAGFIAAEVFTEALRRAGENPTREKLVDALETMKGWSGLITPEITYSAFDEEDNFCRSGVLQMYVMEVRNQEWVTLHDWISLGD
ncbi:MAG TPA: ABC transporter substrate-binding protein [Kosmotogaceae bacterium]|nr:MAG: Amino acid/amide ABC transporter substrate-binding protein, HAAT family [Thermotogales bacterium 46_20]HAA85743.1 ABC transporter substrate-binding protein [Kosmotogaceae bacterium]